ncbi:putative TIGR02611 family protein [Aeromicrobium marinum DSM 15272]|uniref:TIGR02611 family protein n=1 Tax=Aeromicrobium marinum DSM 15272 TaxID=585531 RepID=E2SDH9_9ACTN|nr:PGPGW domain-containing protein [Aeromicrobium marinum]EFQ82556.1 putative TIGR02611 family protein [Aeromicrobium marinum DSM 15272]
MDVETPVRGRRTWSGRLRAWFARTGSELLGWTLVLIGIPMMPLPGPGTIVLVAGVALLARHYTWARRILEPLQRRAVEAARYGVATWPRIIASFAGGVWLVALGVVWWTSPSIPEFTVVGFDLGPELPAAGWITGLGLIASAVAAWALLGYSVRRWRWDEPAPSFVPDDVVVD